MKKTTKKLYGSYGLSITGITNKSSGVGLANRSKNGYKSLFSNKLVAIKWMLLVASVLVMVLSCSKTASGRLGRGTKTIISNEGWVNANTYQMVVYGQWNRDAYYVEGEKKPKAAFGKKPKPLYGLREDAKIAAKVKAMRNFKEKMVAYVKSATKVENSELLNDVIETSLRGVIIAPQAVKEEYSKQHDASVTYLFEANDLKRIVDDAIRETLRRFNEGSETVTAKEDKTKTASSFETNSKSSN
ncbi:hypothetical protein COTS27_01331 [Spirochaetota bacterium]|nr:hypothetical protein COTS27_01331 [Spirochaetota bacterium]